MTIDVDKTVSMIATPFAIFCAVAMIKLWDYNCENTGWLFALAMVLLPIAVTILLIYHYYVNYLKK
jgi:uncharacterized membrane protein